MPTQDISAQIRVVGHGHCGNCGVYAQLIELRITHDGEESPEDPAIRRCSRCVLGSKVSTNVELPPSEVRRRRRILKRAKNCEFLTAKETGSRRTAASGAGIAKGDSRNSNFMFEDKYTESDSYRMSKGILSKASVQAQKSGRTPVIRVHFKSGLTIGVMHWNDILQFVSEDSEDL